MGVKFIDKFTLLHFAMGSVAHYWGISFETWFIIHFLFELIENTKTVSKFIDTYLIIWPGGKRVPDTFINSLGDQIFALLGWMLTEQYTKLF